MESTAIEDFQKYYNLQSVGDMDHDFSPSSEKLDRMSEFEGNIDDDQASIPDSAHFSSGPDEAVFDNVPSRASSPRTSHGSEDEISLLGSQYNPQQQISSPYTPIKARSPFRNPSSVRAMQLDTTPPHLTSPSSQKRHKLFTPSQQCTPRSSRSLRGGISSPSKLSPTKKIKKEYPLVLLHITILPLPLCYSPEILEAVLPSAILENWKILQEKATPTVLARGVLIPHPKEDYDLLEERLLESLELRIPRILKCGHFRLSPEEEANVAANSDEDEDDLDPDSKDLDICLDCGDRIRDGKFGNAGTGSKRWNIKVFAANGLMRAGAWGAAWREMERVDVEILPWMEEDMKRELELRHEEEERAKGVEMTKEEGVGGLDDERLREIYGGETQASMDGFAGEMPATVRMPKQAQYSDQHPQRQGVEVPLWDLLKNYICHTAQDRRNIAIFVLSIVILLLSTRSSSPTGRTEASLRIWNERSPPLSFAQVPMSSIIGAASTDLISSSAVVQASEPPTIGSSSESIGTSLSSAVSRSCSPSPEPRETEEGTSPSSESVGDIAQEMVED